MITFALMTFLPPYNGTVFVMPTPVGVDMVRQRRT
jgi:hypothetical protein